MSLENGTFKRFFKRFLNAIELPSSLTIDGGDATEYECTVLFLFNKKENNLVEEGDGGGGGA